MEKFSVRLYTKKDYQLWNDFISEAKNSTFLFHRDFMEYHKDRFQDFSLMVFKKEKLVAVLPANIEANNVHSHQGLTYGGVVTKNIRTTLFFEIFREILFFLKNQQIENLYLKEIPYFYNSFPNDEWKYLAFICNAELYRRDLCSTIDLKKKFQLSEIAKRKVKKSEKLNITYRKSDDVEIFWKEILEPELQKNHFTKPVHSLEEIQKLKKNFPENIIFYGVYSGEQLIGGCLIFKNRKVAHCQYISVKSEFKESGALYLLHYKLITEEFKNFDYFDFGISQEMQGRKTNQGLLFWKENFGAAGVSQDFYKIRTENYFLIDEMYL